MTQHERIITYLKLFDSITPMDAYEKLGITKLATRIGELKRKGYKFDSKMESGTSRWGDECEYKRYWLIEREAE